MDWNAIAAIGTTASVAVGTIGIWFAFKQIKNGAHQKRTDWECELTKEYREIMRGLPRAVRLGEAMDDAEIDKHLPHFLNYFDLSNQQAFLAEANLVSKRTWEEWRSGIVGNLRSTGPFGKAWVIVKRRWPEQFHELARLEERPSIAAQSDSKSVSA